MATPSPTSAKRFVVLIAGFAAVNSTAVLGADEYLPPPTGPYQSSVVINTGENNASQQVYRFPPSDLIQMTPDSDVVRTDTPFRTGNGNFPQQQTNPPGPAVGSRGSSPITTNESATPRARSFSGDPALFGNPWAESSQQAVPAGRPGNWASPYNGYTYPYPYPYGYGAQYNMTNPYPMAPSPWTVAPVQPYPGR